MAPLGFRRPRGSIAAASVMLGVIISLVLGLVSVVAAADSAAADQGGSPAEQASSHGSASQSDTAAPRLRTHGPVVVHTSTPTLSGVGWPGKGTVTVKVAGTADDGTSMTGRSCNATKADSGGWTCTFSGGLKDGTYTLTIVHGVAGGKKSIDTTSCTLVVDTPAAAPPAPTETAAPEPKPTETAAPEPKQTKTAKAEAKPTKSTATTAPQSAAAPARTAAPATAAKAADAVAEEEDPEPIEWTFAIVDETGDDVSGAPLEPGAHLSVVATGLPEGSHVKVELHSTPVSLVDADVDASGDLTAPFTLPTATEAGAHAIVATLTGDGIAASIASMDVQVAERVTETVVLAAGPEAPDVTLTPVVEEEPTRRLSDVMSSWSMMEISPYTVAATGGLAAAFVLLAALPAELLQSTLAENYHRAFAWLTPVRRRTTGLRERLPQRLRNPWLGSAVSVGLVAVILGFSEPQFGFNTWSVRTFLALYLSLYAINVFTNVVKLTYASRRLNVAGSMSPLPGGMLIAAISVLVSRWLEIEPSLLFGLVVGVTLAHTQSKEIEGRIALVGAAAVLGLGVTSWVGLSLVEANLGHDTNFFVGLFEDTLAATALEALTVLLMGLLPFDYLEGKALHDWDQRIWAAAYFVAAAAFVFLAVPLGESWEESSNSILTWLAIIGGFALISVAAWFTFHVLPERRHAHDEAREHEPV